MARQHMERVDARVTPKQKEAWKEAARIDPRTQIIPREDHRLSAWLRVVLDAEAEKILKKFSEN